MDRRAVLVASATAVLSACAQLGKQALAVRLAPLSKAVDSIKVAACSATFSVLPEQLVWAKG